MSDAPYLEMMKDRDDWRRMCREADAKIAELTAALAEREADTKRLDFLEEAPVMAVLTEPNLGHMVMRNLSPLSGWCNSLRDAIDEAMATGGEG